MRAPMAAYAALAAEGRRVSRAAALCRPALVALVTGCAAAISSTGHVTLGLVATTTLAWSFVVVLQIAIALAVVAGPARRSIGIATALDRFFAAHGPWSLWMLSFALWTVATPAVGQPIRWAEVSALVPAAWTARLVYAFHVRGLGLEPRAALRRTIAHQALTWIAVLVFAGVAVQVWPRLLQAAGR
jgi:hypothetical protein